MCSAYVVICSNDSLEYVFPGETSRATIEEALEKLAYAKYKYNKHAWKSYKEYRQLVFWHTHDVDGLKP